MFLGCGGGGGKYWFEDFLMISNVTKPIFLAQSSISQNSFIISYTLYFNISYLIGHNHH